MAPSLHPAHDNIKHDGGTGHLSATLLHPAYDNVKYDVDYELPTCPMRIVRVEAGIFDYNAASQMIYGGCSDSGILVPEYLFLPPPNQTLPSTGQSTSNFHDSAVANPASH